MKTFEEKATHLAKEAKAAIAAWGDTDLGCFHDPDTYGDMSDDEWLALVERAEQLMPTVTVTRKAIELYQDAARACRAEDRSEAIAFSAHY